MRTLDPSGRLSLNFVDDDKSMRVYRLQHWNRIPVLKPEMEACTYQHCQPDAILLDAVMPVMDALPVVATNCGPCLGSAHACIDGH